MSKSVAMRCSSRLEAQKTSRKRGGEDEEKEDGEEQNEEATPNSTTLTTVSTAPATTDQFMHTPEFRRYFVECVPGNTLMALMLWTKGWNTVADALIDEGVKSGELMVHDGKDINFGAVAMARQERRKLVTRVIFLLNITKVGERACCNACNLVVVDIPEGIECIGDRAFVTAVV
ncbi:hypothetical protein TL16_g06746 [Triparma laevis f. inornata]|uniref:Uncharacterized protein n=1 Tax=Triparma laevis f. inornata TaxID=1714386 RepID=A0A9W7ALZ5_9STRA|nr:hypothetical protein TL16_g06746 [Triparma laevis f. inornata]